MSSAVPTQTAADLLDASSAITFAMASLERWEVPMFLEDWQNGSDLSPWLKGPSEWLEALPAK